MIYALPSLTVCIAVDEEHADELELVYPTWCRYKPWLVHLPFHVYCDDARPVEWWNRRLSFLDRSHIDFWLWSSECSTQREKMLSALVYGPPETVKTQYFIKIDTDVVATGPFQGCELSGEWFAANPVFVASPWGYTKPADAIARLDAWGDRTPGVNCHPPLELPYDAASRRIVHGRIISWLYFGRTDWHAWAAGLLKGGRLPIPSQDTYLWYLARRCECVYGAIRFSQLGWRHVGSSVRRLRSVVSMAMPSDAGNDDESDTILYEGVRDGE